MRLAIVGSLTVFGMLAFRGALALADPHPNNGPTTVVGTPGDDVLGGNHGPDVLYGKAGDDRLWGGKGPDTFYGGRGYDVCHNIRDTGHDEFHSCELVKTS